MKNAIDYLTEKGWKISSDPRQYDNYPKNYGYRNYIENGINYDSFCGGYHRAFDVYSNATNDVPSVTSGTVVTAETHGNFGGTLEVRDANGNDWIYGHLQRDSLRFKKGDLVNQGDVVGLQGSSNYDDNPMAVHLHIQLRPKGTDLSDEKAEVCTGLPIETYDISKLNKKQDNSNNGSVKELKHIYSSHIKGNKITSRKPSIQGIVIHNDYGSMTPSSYLPWLYGREKAGTHVNGWASVYVNRNECLWYHPTDYVEWHCGNTWANNNLIGLEVCESYPGRISDKIFLENEEATLKVAADILKSYDLPVNRSTVNLHRQYFGTSCPHRSWDIHVGKGAANTTANNNKMKDYFVKRIKHYYDGGKLETGNAETIQQEDVKQEVNEHKNDQVVSSTDWKKNTDGVLYKAEQATFTVTANEGIITRYTGPWTGWPQAGLLQKGQSINYSEIQKYDGHVWVSWDTFEGETVYMPVRTWNSKTGKLGPLWGTIK